MGNANTLECPTPKLESKKAPRARPKAIETELVSSQRSDGHYYLIYKTVVSITSIASSIKIRAMLKSKFGTINNSSGNFSNARLQSNSSNSNINSQKSKDKQSNKHNHHSSHNNNGSNNSSSYISSYSYDSDYDSESNYNSNSNSNTASRNRFSTSSAFNSAFNDEYNSIKNMDYSEYNEFCGQPTQPESNESSLLYDPGVITDTPEVPHILKKLPMSEYFSEISTAALNDIQLRDTIMRTKKIDASQDARKVAIVAMKLGDAELFDMALNSMKKMKKDIVLAELMRIRTAEGKSWVPILKTTEATQIPKMTINENNAMI